MKKYVKTESIRIIRQVNDLGWSRLVVNNRKDLSFLLKPEEKSIEVINLLNSIVMKKIKSINRLYFKEYCFIVDREQMERVKADILSMNTQLYGLGIHRYKTEDHIVYINYNLLYGNIMIEKVFSNNDYIIQTCLDSSNLLDILDKAYDTCNETTSFKVETDMSALKDINANRYEYCNLKAIRDNKEDNDIHFYITLYTKTPTEYKEQFTSELFSISKPEELLSLINFIKTASNNVNNTMNLNGGIKHDTFYRTMSVRNAYEIMLDGKLSYEENKTSKFTTFLDICVVGLLATMMIRLVLVLLV